LVVTGTRASHAVALAACLAMVGGAHAQDQKGGDIYPRRAQLPQYLARSEAEEVALARSAAPDSVSGLAEVQVLTAHGYRTAASGRNGFVCMVWRSWSDDFGDGQFWNPKVRAPICLNPIAAKTVLPAYLRRTDWALAGLSRAQMAARFRSAVDRNEVAAPGAGAMSYMMSRRGYLADGVGAAAPHIMFFVPRDARQQWGANLPGSPIWSGQDALDPVALFFVSVPKWSDGTQATGH
jgi:hypothetical protein